MKLIMAKVGARPTGRLIEQHDVVFGIVNTVSDMVAIIDKTWHEVKGQWHVDAWREVTRVGDYHISIVVKQAVNQDADQVLTEIATQSLQAVQPCSSQLFFINLGGYLPNQFEEFHYKTLVVADSMAKAAAQVRKSDFYRDYTFANADTELSGVATSHIDDKQQLDIDEIHQVSPLIEPTYSLMITPLTDEQKRTLPNDELHIGYLPIKALKLLKR